MSPRDKKDLSPFGLSAVSLDADFVELERLSRQIERLAIDSDSGLERAQRLLVKFAECGQRVADGATGFSKVLDEARARAEKAAQVVSARALEVQERQRENDRMLERFRLLSETVGQISALLAPFRRVAGSSLSQEDRVLIQQQIPDIDLQLGTLIEETFKLRQDAHDSKMRSVERNADSLAQTLASARRKLSELLKSLPVH
jgi:hypothetical protein